MQGYTNEANYLDSTEGETNFLAAIGFENPARSDSHAPTTPSGAVPQSQKKIKSTKEPVELAHKLPNHSKNSGPGQMSSSQWKHVPDQPQPLTANYWESQRVAKGLANPSSYPTPSAPTARGASPACALQRTEGHHFSHNTDNERDKEGPSAGFLRLTNPNPKARLPPGQEHKKVAGQHPGNLIGGVPNGGNAHHEQQPGANSFPMDRVSPDLTAFRVPRPNKDYAGSSTPSLPSSVSAVDISDTGVGARGSNEEKSSADIRQTIGLMPNIHKSGNTWHTYNWGDPTGRDDNEALCAPSYLGAFISAWMNEAADSLLVSFTHGTANIEHWKCDIDTNTGFFVSPVSYPESFVDHSQIDSELERRRQNWTSSLLMRRRQNWTSSLLMRRHQVAPRRHQRRGNNDRRETGQHGGGEEVTEVVDENLIVKIHEHHIDTPEYNHFVPRVPCFLRPAERYDMEAVRLIYNWEVQHGLQALDSNPLSAADFEKLLTTTQDAGMPFIVAVRGSARDLGLTKGNLIYSTFQQIPFRDAGNERGEILGFAFLSAWQPGLAGGGTSTSNSQPTARIHVYVHPDHRRKKIGFSLLDMLLTAVSDRFSSQSGYDFVDPDGSPVYKTGSGPGGGGAERRYFHLYLSYLVRHRHRTEGDAKLEREQKGYGEDLKWVKTLLEERLNFTEVVRFEAVRRSGGGCGEGKGCWLDEVVFEHTCLFDPLDTRMKVE